jgi:hypothetical protein
MRMIGSDIVGSLGVGTPALWGPRLLDEEAMTGVCRDFGISRGTGYKIFDQGACTPTSCGSRSTLKICPIRASCSLLRYRTIPAKDGSVCLSLQYS